MASILGGFPATKTSKNDNHGFIDSGITLKANQGHRDDTCLRKATNGSVSRVLGRYKDLRTAGLRKYVESQ